MPTETTPDKINLAIFISGRGSNMSALIEACKDSSFPARIELVLSNRPDAKGLEAAQKAGIQTEIIDHKAYDNREHFENAVLTALKTYDIDLICLAGFMRLLSSHFITPWAGRMINIHPSLLPDYKGLNTHERALADGKTETGCTVHYVVPDMDSGEIIMQRRCPIAKDDTPDTLAGRVLEQEHIAYPDAVRMIAQKLLPPAS